MVLIKTESRSLVTGQPLCWKWALSGLLMLGMAGCHYHSQKKCVTEGNCVSYPTAGTAGFYTTCWSEWQEGPVSCVPAWAPPPTVIEEVPVSVENGVLPPIEEIPTAPSPE